ncbi:hypothetical protein SAMN06296273_0012 [Nitrosomonas ureae]|uniref:Uncharacterized protein n=1 Tax=Nitrosomonas ureae TaxID=44577 RepID=A0A285BTJ2_9PROT|nr:hypothetical protein SAMN06296273_0012 [Nitrosomonas ureae]
MRILLVALLIALFFIVTISKADNFSPESAEGARAVSTETAKETLIYSITSNRCCRGLINTWL